MTDTEKLLQEIKPLLAVLVHNARHEEHSGIHDTGVEILKVCKVVLIFKDGEEIEL